MTKIRGILMVLGCIVLALGVSGCGSSGGDKVGGVGADGDLGLVQGSDVYGEPLADRPLEGEEYASQFEAVYFDYDSSQVNPSERIKIESVADYMRGNAQVGVIVEGHCDERGSREYNMALGERRALAVRAYLIGLGIDGGRIQTKSYGEEKPVTFGHDEGSWDANRRSEFVLFY
jgi:peptidoglycan-associated lipoprotein